MKLSIGKIHKGVGCASSPFYSVVLAREGGGGHVPFAAVYQFRSRAVSLLGLAFPEVMGVIIFSCSYPPLAAH